MSASGSMRALTRETAYYGVGAALQKLVSFLLFPVYARVLSQADFGAQDLAMTVFSIGYALMMLGMDNGAARLYYDAREAGDRGALLSTSLLTVGVVSLAVTMPLVPFAASLAGLLFDSPGLAGPLRLALLCVPLAVLGKIPTLALRLNFRARAYSLVTLVYVICFGAGSILFVVVLRRGVSGVLLANLVAAAVQLALGVAASRRYLRFRFSLRLLRGMLAFGLPTVPASISLWILNSSNRYFMVREVPLSAIGVFAVAGKIGAVVTLGVSAFQTAWPMFAFSLSNDRESARLTYGRTLRYYLALTLSLAIAVSLFGRELAILLAGSGYAEAGRYVPFIALGSVMWGASDIVGIGYSIEKRSYHITVTTVLGAGVNTVCNALLVHPFGLIGAAIGIAAGYLASLGYSYLAGRRYVRLPIDRVPVAAMVAATVIAVAGWTLFDVLVPDTGFLSVAVRALVVVLYGVILYATGVVNRDTLRAVRRALARE